MTWIQTLDGMRCDLLNPSVSAINATTLAVVLGRICRFGCHPTVFYSVAQHSVLVESLVEDPELKLPALLHDAHEAYWGFGDICRPAKCLTPELRDFFKLHQLRFDMVIAQRFGFDPELFHAPAIKHADNVALATEARDLMTEPPCPWDLLPPPNAETICPMQPLFADRLFGKRLLELWKPKASHAVA